MVFKIITKIKEKQQKVMRIFSITESKDEKGQKIKEEKRNKILLWSGRINRGALYLLVFLLPLFFLPWTSDVLDFNKQALLFVLVFISGLAWLGKHVSQKQFRIRKTFVYWLILGFLLVLGLTTNFSLYRAGSFWGWPLKVNQSFLTFFALALFFFLVLNSFRKKQEVFHLFSIFLISSFFTVVFGILQIFGRFLFPWQFSRISSFNTIGATNSWAIFLAAFLPVLILFIHLARSYFKWFLKVVFLVSFFGLFLVNFWVAWLVVLAGMAMILMFGGLGGGQEGRKGWLVASAFLLAIALLFGIFRIPIGGLPAIPFEVSLTPSSTFEIARQTLKQNPILGTGPGTFGYNFSLYKSPDLNQTIFWNIRFNSGASEILERLATFGILGTLTLMALILGLVFVGFKALLRFEGKSSDEDELSASDPSRISAKTRWLVGLGIFSSFFAVCVSLFLYPNNLSLEFLFWFFGAGFLRLGSKKIKRWKLEPAKVQSILVSFGFILAFTLVLAIFVFAGQRYFAQVRYFQGLKAMAGEDIEGSIINISRATQLDPLTDIYWRDLSQAAILQLNQEIVRRDLAQEELSQRIQFFLSLAVNSAVRATDVSPNNVANWQVRGFVYRSLIGLVEGSFDWALESYQRAQELEPVSPLIPLEISRTYSTQANLMAQLEREEEIAKNLEKAQEYLQKAISLKPDFWPAHFQQAIVFDMRGKLDEAIAKLEEIKPFNLQDVVLAFQLGSYYWRKEDLDRAKQEFERAVLLSPDHSNARYFLGLIYDKQGERKKAISQFEIIAAFSEENRQQVAEILKNLRAGRPALGEEVGVLPGREEEIPILEQPE